MALLALVFDSSTGRLFAQKVGSDQIGNGAVLSAHIGAGIIGGTHIYSGTTMPAFTLGGVVTGNNRDIGGLASLTVTTIYPDVINFYYPAHGYIKGSPFDGRNVYFQVQKFGVGLVKVAALMGAVDPYFQATLPMVLNPSLEPTSGIVEGHFWYASGLNALKYRDTSVTKTLATTPVLSGDIATNIIGTPHIANQGLLSASIGAGIIGGAHLNIYDQWPGRIFSGEITIRTQDARGILLTALSSYSVLKATNIHPTIGFTLDIETSGQTYAGDMRFLPSASGLPNRWEFRTVDGFSVKTALTILSGNTIPEGIVAGILSGHRHTGTTGGLQILSGGIGSGNVGAIHIYPFTSGQVIIGQGTETPVYGGVPAGTPGDNTITSAKIASGQVGDGHIYPASILSGKIGANIIATPHIANQGLLSSVFGANIIATTHIRNQGILSASFGAGVLAGVHIIAGGITSANYASGSINGVHIANASILSSDIGANVIGLPLFQRFASGQIMKGQGTGANPIYKDEMAAIAFVIDGFGSSIQSGGKGWIEMPFPGTLNRVTMLANQSGQITVDIWKQTYAAFPPAAANSICSSVLPRISGSFKNQDSSLSGWVKTIASGDILYFMVPSNASSIQLCTVSLGMYK